MPYIPFLGKFYSHDEDGAKMDFHKQTLLY